MATGARMTYRVFVQPTGLYSRAMTRIANALTAYAPPNVTVVDKHHKADIVVMYVIGSDAIAAGKSHVTQGRSYVAVQCCLKSAGYDGSEEWHDFWRQSDLVWSYYDLGLIAHSAGFRFYHSPLGVDDCFRHPFNDTQRERLIITSGYMDGPGCEAITEVWEAVAIVNRNLGLAGSSALRCFHVGPSQPAGMPRQLSVNPADAPATMPDGWSAREGISDEELASLYRRALLVSGLRHVEGFELPAAEGLLCGARPLLFSRPDMREWYKFHHYTLPECSGVELVDALVDMLPAILNDNWPVTERDRQELLARFDWKTICTEFWARLLEDRQE